MNVPPQMPVTFVNMNRTHINLFKISMMCVFISGTLNLLYPNLLKIRVRS